MIHTLEYVHGIPFKKLANLVNRELSESKDIIELISENIGGWSNINILGSSKFGKVVLKLPAHIGPYEDNPYLEEFRTCEFLSYHNLCPKPLSTGFLDDNNNTPYMLYRYVDGLIYESPTEISSAHLESLREALHLLAELKTPDIRDYYEPSSMISNSLKALEFPEMSLENVTPAYCEIRDELKAISYSIMDIVDSVCQWSKLTIHGDLQESNIVFQGNKAFFLDLKSCSLAEPLYDIAYFLVQAPGPVLPCPAEFMLGENDLAVVECLTPIALLSVTIWTLNRLINQELGLIEENLVSQQTTQNMLSYLKVKHSELRKRVHYLK